jgi:succinate dehydrogenase/fumarate reductase flavoprotein subunit
MAAGAALGNMSEAWWAPAISVPGETIEGEPLHRLILTERARPGSLIVDSTGRRFFDEHQNYNDAGRALHAFDPGGYSFPRVPSWLLFDAHYRASYHLGPLRKGDPDPDWILKAGTLAELAELMPVPPDGLEATVARFNEQADRGVDVDFGRGSRLYDRFLGSWGPLGDGPYYAVRVLPGCLGTKGGPRTDAEGRVLSLHGGPLDRLFAAGNAAANPFGMAYPGAGGTIGPALVFGARAGRAAAS